MSLETKAWVLCLGLLAGKAALGATPTPAACPDNLKFLGPACAQWQARLLPEAPPASRGNAMANSDPAAVLGMRVFYDNRFSKEGSGVACVNCHDPERAFTERKAVPHGIADGTRNTPDLLNAPWYARSHFWDGKIDNLWSAPLFAFEQENELGSSRLHVVHTLDSIYKIRYEAIFGPMPDFSDAQRFPASGKPGVPAYDAMAAKDRELINTVYANIGKSLEAYVRKLAAGRSSFDDFINGAPISLSPAAQRGMVAFTRLGCGGCHAGPTFTDESFHDIGHPFKSAQPTDPARAGGMAFAAQWDFTSTSRFADPGMRTTAAGADGFNSANTPQGFRTPTLRNVAVTAPYGHDGSFATLEQAIDAHARVLPGKAAPGDQDRQDIIELLRALTGRPPQRPWNYWPGG